MYAIWIIVAIGIISYLVHDCGWLAVPIGFVGATVAVIAAEYVDRAVP